MKADAKLVRTQSELDKALKDGVTDLIVDAPNGAWLEISTDGFVRLWGSSRVVAWESSSVVARGSSSVVARGSSSVVAWESSSVVAWESSSVVAWESSSVVAWGSSSVVARGSSSVVAWGSSSVVAWESSSVVAWESSSVVARGSSSVVARGSSRVEAWESSSVVAWESSSVVARGSSSVVAWGSSSVVARGSSRVEAWESSSVVAGRWTAVHVWSQHVTLDSTGHIIDMTQVDLADVDTWREYVGADRPADPEAQRLIVGRVSSQDHEGRLDRDGRITIGCWSGDVAGLRALAAGSRWPSGANSTTRKRFAPRLLAFADMCETQIEAWKLVQA